LEGLYERLAISEGETAMWSGQMSMITIWTITMAFARRVDASAEKYPIQEKPRRVQSEPAPG